MNANITLPSPEDAEQAQIAVRALSAVLKKKAVRTLRVQPEGVKKPVTVTVPKEAFELIEIWRFWTIPYNQISSFRQVSRYESATTQLPMESGLSPDLN